VLYSCAMNGWTAHSPLGQEWLPFATLDLPGAQDAELPPDDRIAAWLVETLRPLALPADFAGKLLASVQASSTFMPASSRQVTPARTRLMVFTSTTHPLPGQNWGFFRIEKHEGLPTDENGVLRALAFYLYVETAA
jgi:hypothetical protein